MQPLVLNEQQIAAIKAHNTHSLVVAGAGSGKTRTIIERVAFLLEQGVAPEKILLLTFTRKAAQEIIHRLSVRLDNAEKVRSGTFHNFCLWAMRSHPHLYEDMTNSIVIDRDDQLRLMRVCRENIVGEKEGSKKRSGRTQQLPKSAELINIVSYARNTDIDLPVYLQKFHHPIEQEGLEKTIAVLKDYRKRKQENRYLDFDDLLIHFAQSLKEPHINQYFRKCFEHILVDEMQDTNVIQWYILKRLINPAWLYCVGDDAQSIYAFRGATPENLTQFAQNAQNATKFQLTINYRSTQEILNLANEILARADYQYDKHLQSTRGSGKKPVLKDFVFPEEEAQWIVKDIQKRIKSGTKLSQIMILMRTARNARLIEGLLIEARIPYQFFGGQSLLSAAHVKDLLAVCRAPLNKNDILAWIRWLSLYPGVGEKTALRVSEAIRSLGAEQQITDILQTQLGRNHDSVAAYQIANSDQLTIPEILHNLTDLLSSVLSQTYDQWDNRKKDLLLLSELAKRFRSLKNFIEAYTLDPITVSTALANETEDALTLSTIHSAKGLEANVCYIIQAQRGSFPHSRSKTPEEIEEERRILYVAITRAKNELFLTRTLPEGYVQFDEKEYFLADIPEQKKLVEYESAKPKFAKHSLWSN